MLQYQLQSNDCCLARIFDVLANNCEEMGIMDFSVSQTTLDQVRKIPSVISDVSVINMRQFVCICSFRQQVIRLFPFFFLQVFVSFAKEQTDDDVLTDVVINNGAAQLTFPSRTNPPAVQPQPPTAPPQQQKTPQLTEKSPESSKPRKSRASKAKSNEERSGSIAMSTLQQEGDKAEDVGSSGSRSGSGNGHLQEESSKPHRSKRSAATSSKDASSLFIVGSNAHDSSL